MTDDEQWSTLMERIDRAYADLVTAAHAVEDADYDSPGARLLLRGGAVAISAMVDGFPQCADDIYAVLCDQLTTA